MKPLYLDKKQTVMKPLYFDNYLGLKIVFGQKNGLTCDA